MPTILVVEDETAVNNLIRDQLLAEGYGVVQAFDGPAALRLVEENRPDLVVLDWMLPGMDGLTVCRQIRRGHLMPIIMLTARGAEIDRVVGLEVGADDYVVKPFGVRELLARIRALLRRIEMDAGAPAAVGTAVPAAPLSGAVLAPVAPRTAAETVVHGPLRIDLAGRSVLVDGTPVELTKREFDLLALLATNPGRAFSRAYLVERLWSDEGEVFDRAVDSHIVRLRRKLGAAGNRIATVWGVGYRFSA
jgi:DNA-binding response OmpR family regulator